MEDGKERSYENVVVTWDVEEDVVNANGVVEEVEVVDEVGLVVSVGVVVVV